MTLTAEARRRARTLDQIRHLAIEGAAAVEGARLADPLTGPRPAHTWDTECEPIYSDLVAELGVPGQDIPAGPLVAGDGFVLTGAGDIEHVEVTAARMPEEIADRIRAEYGDLAGDVIARAEQMHAEDSQYAAALIAAVDDAMTTGGGEDAEELTA